MSETPLNLPGAGRAPHIQKILATLGGRPVLLPIELGKKGPEYAGWQNITWEQTQNPAFSLRVRVAALPLESGAENGGRWENRNYGELLDAGNVGVLLGNASVLEDAGRTWHLCSIDVDDDASVDAFLAVNPGLAGTLQTHGKRGRNFWVWVEGESPPEIKGLCWIATEDKDSVTAPGKKIVKGGRDVDRRFGEWRATGGQTVIYGTHPKGGNYSVLVDAAPVRLRFDEIAWPAGLYLPWLQEKIEEEQRLKEAERVAEMKRQEEVLAGLIGQYGRPWTLSKKGKLTINQAFFAAFYGTKHKIFHSAEEQRFFRYQGEKSGLWIEQTADSIRWEMAADIKQIADEQDGAEGAEQLINARTTQLMNALVAMLKGSVERWRAFERQICPKTNRPRALIHLQNGMLDLDEETPQLLPFAPEYYSRNQLAVSLREDAKCPRFLGELLGGAVSLDDIVLMQKYAGQILLGVNLAQKLLILTGTAGGGKSTFVNAIAEIIGRINIAQLRTEHLAERFEIFGFLDKTLLLGVDVPGDFLMIEGARVIKGLTGGDLLDAEAKTGNRRFQVKGEFNILVTCNSRLKVRLDGDGDAWRRRLDIVKYEKPKPAKADPNYVHRLIAEEGSGILNWMIEGAILLLRDLAETGGIVRTKDQKERVESLLAESDSVRDFVRRGCQKADRNSKVTSEQLQQAYIAYCEARGWSPMGGKTVSYQLPDALLEIHGATQVNDIKLHEGDKAKRGYRGVIILAIDNGEDPLAGPAVPAAPPPTLLPEDDQHPFGE